MRISITWIGPASGLPLFARNHGDHCDKDSDLIRTSRFGAVHELNWGEQVEVSGLKIRAFEVNHWGARVRTDTYRGYNGYLIESARYRIVFGGDTAHTHSSGG